MQTRLFDKKNANVFKNESTDEFNVNRLAQIFQLQTGEEAKEINKLLFAVQTFIAATAPEFQAMRDKKITETHIIAILDNIGKELKAFSEKYKGNFKNDLFAKEALLYCERATQDQLNAMDKSDKIHVYYTNNSSTLKDMLNTYARLNSTM